MITIIYTTKSNNFKIINSILYYAAILYKKNSDSHLELQHLDSFNNDNLHEHFYILPYGITNIKYNDFHIKIERIKTSKEPIEFNNGYNIDFSNNIYITALNINIIEKFIEDAQLFYNNNYYKHKKKSNIIKYYIFDNNFWSILHERDKRHFNTIYLDSNVSDNILNDMKDFLNIDTKLKYKKFGIPYKKNYLFEGVEGSGKTSLSIALASSLNKDIAILNFDNNMNDKRFMKAVKNIPNDTILCIEDIDVLFFDRKNLDSHKNMITFSGLLNILDGFGTKDGLITIITTNYINKLDNTLKRPGRIDKIIHFDYVTDFQIKNIYSVFYPSHANDSNISIFIKTISNHNITVSMLQQYFFSNKHHDILKNINQLFSMENNSKKYNNILYA